MVADAHSHGENASVNNQSRYDRYASLLDLYENALVQFVQVSMARSEIPEADNVKMNFCQELKLAGMLDDQRSKVLSLIDILLQDSGELLQSVRLEHHPDLE